METTTTPWINRIIFSLCISASISISAGDKYANSIDPRLLSREWRIDLISNNQPPGNHGFQYRLFEAPNELVLVYERKASILKVISLKGTVLTVIPKAQIFISENGLKYNSSSFQLVDSGEFGAKL